jgi:hypothetical protein
MKEKLEDEVAFYRLHLLKQGDIQFTDACCPA